VFVDKDVADGYVAEVAALAPFGRWEGDATYGVHWCPAPSSTGAAFRPYLSGGHWTTSDHAEYGSPAGTITWTDDDDRPWAEVTTHQGWWIDRGGNDWCWVPGVQQTPARVVWRDGDGFVGWAPEPPAWVDDGDDGDDVGFEWCFELMGTLLEDATDGYVLTGDAVQSARQATAPSRHLAEPGVTFSRRPPARPTVVAAHTQLVAYVRAHPDASATTAVAGHASATATAASGVSGASSSSTSGSSSTSTSGSGSASGHATRVDTTEDTLADLSADHLPPAAVLVPVMMNDPVEGRAGVRFGGSSTGGGSAGSSSGSFGSYGSSGSSAIAQNGGSRRFTHASSNATGGGSSGRSYRSFSGSSSHSSSSSSGHSSSSSSHSSSGHHK
jgi:hypothetical protein